MDGVGALSSGGTLLAERPNGFSELTSEQFVKIIFTELGNQDPLQPNDSKALLEQLSSIRSIQSDLDLSRRLEAIVTQNELSSASGMIGRRVSGLNESNTRVQDVVTSVSRTSSGAVLNLRGGDRVALRNVDQILEGGAP